MIAPMLHLNGSGYPLLMEQLNAAIRALVDAEHMMQQAVPHARDYYPISNSAHHYAMGDHEHRIERLSDIRAELVAIRQNIENQQDQRLENQR